MTEKETRERWNVLILNKKLRYFGDLSSRIRKTFDIIFKRMLEQTINDKYIINSFYSDNVDDTEDILGKLLDKRILQAENRLKKLLDIEQDIDDK